MPRIRCHYLNCLFLDDKYCSAAAVEINPDSGCQTYSPNCETETVDWEDDEDLNNWDDIDADNGNDNLWIDEDEDSTGY